MISQLRVPATMPSPPEHSETVEASALASNRAMGTEPLVRARAWVRSDLHYTCTAQLGPLCHTVQCLPVPSHHDRTAPWVQSELLPSKAQCVEGWQGCSVVKADAMLDPWNPHTCHGGHKIKVILIQHI